MVTWMMCSPMRSIGSIVRKGSNQGGVVREDTGSIGVART